MHGHASMACAPGRVLAPTHSSNVLSSRAFLGSTGSLGGRLVTVRPQRLQSLQVFNAITKEKKVETVAKLVSTLESSTLVFGFQFKGLTVKQLHGFRRSLPEQSKLIVCKNRLLKVAADQVGGWADLKDSAKGDNAWLFVNEECIAESVKAYLAFEKTLDDAIPKELRGKLRGLNPSGGVMTGRPLDYDQFKCLEKLPTKLELIATIARLVKQVPTKVARSINQVPTKVAYGIKALADGDDNKELKVGDVFPKSA